MLKIGFEAKRAVANNTGLGNYNRLIIDLLSQEYPDNEYLLYTPTLRKSPRLEYLLERKNIVLKSSADCGSKLPASLWRVFTMGGSLNSDKIDIFHGLSGELPLDIKKSGVPSVVTIHDLIFRPFPQYYKLIDRTIYDYKYRKACENADRVIAISECTKRDVMKYYGIPESKIDVVYQGCDEIFAKPWSKEDLESVRAKYNLPNKYILYVGTIEERKNSLLLLKSALEVDEDVEIVIVGGVTPYKNKLDEFIAEHNMEGRVHFYSGVPFGDLPAFYRLSSLFVYPSRYEGFGIPMLEALTCGIPAIGATGSCLEEAGGEWSIYVNPDDEKELASAINKVLNDNILRDEMIRKGYEYASKFSKESIARNIMNIYNKVL